MEQKGLMTSRIAEYSYDLGIPSMMRSSLVLDLDLWTGTLIICISKPGIQQKPNSNRTLPSKIASSTISQWVLVTPVPFWLVHRIWASNWMNNIRKLINTTGVH